MKSNTDDAVGDTDDALPLQQEIIQDYLDEADYKIFRALNTNGRMSDTELAERVGLSRTAVRRRRERLVEDGILEILAVIVLQEGEFAYGDALLKLDTHATSTQRNLLIEHLIDAELIYSVDTCLGEYDLFIRLWHSSMNQLKSYTWELLEDEPAVDDFTLIPIIKTWKAWDKVLDRPQNDE